MSDDEDDIVYNAAYDQYEDDLAMAQYLQQVEDQAREERRVRGPAFRRGTADDTNPNILYVRKRPAAFIKSELERSKDKSRFYDVERPGLLPETALPLSYPKDRGIGGYRGEKRRTDTDEERRVLSRASAVPSDDYYPDDEPMSGPVTSSSSSDTYNRGTKRSSSAPAADLPGRLADKYHATAPVDDDRIPLELFDSWAEEDYAILRAHERDITLTAADPDHWNLGVSSPFLRHEQKWLEHITRPEAYWDKKSQTFIFKKKVHQKGIYIIESKQTNVDMAGNITGVVWKGWIYQADAPRVPFTIVYYPAQYPNSCVLYVPGTYRRVLEYKIW